MKKKNFSTAGFVGLQNQNTSLVMIDCTSSYNQLQSNTTNLQATSGAIAGQLYNATITSCISTFNNIYAKGNLAASGGIVGISFLGAQFSSFRISNSTSSNNILFSEGLYNNDSYCAGVVSLCQGICSISQCNSTNNQIGSSSISSKSLSGGISSFHYSSFSIINCRTSNCSLFSSSPSNLSYAGGISAYLFGTTGTVLNCISSFNNLTGGYVGGVIAYNNVNVTNCFYGMNNFSLSVLSGLCIADDLKINLTTCFNLFDLTTLTPSTLPPSTLPPSTLPPSILPSTLPPSTLPSSLLPTLTIPPSSTPSDLLSSTITQSTHSSSTLSPSTIPPSTLPPSTVEARNCSFNVPNCDKCNVLNFFVNESLYNISCIFFDNKWTYSFKLKSSDTFVLSETVNLEESFIYIEGNFNQTSNSTIVIVSSNQNRNGSLFVNGCLSLHGNISVVLNEKPTSSNYSLVLINYNCTDTLVVSDSQINLKTEFQSSKCDKISSQLNNQPNSLSLTVSTNFGKCNSFSTIFFISKFILIKGGGISKGAIFGIVFGILGGTILIILIIYYFKWKVDRDFENQMNRIEMDEKPKNWNENDNHINSKSTKWKDFQQK